MKTMKKSAKVIGDISGIVGTSRVRVPTGYCEIEDTGRIDDVIVYWDQGGKKISAKVSMTDYVQYCESGDIKIIA